MPDRDNKVKGSHRTTPYGTPDPSEAETEIGVLTPSLSPLAVRYELLGELGRGGMGIVYKARDRETEEVVALKVLRPEIAARPDLIERFKSELRLARKITHKNVCRTHELLRFGDTVVIAMEYVEGESLRHFLDRYGSVPLRRGLEWVGQVCSALTEAHAQNVVHRDLKPENIVVTRDGSAKVMDFGIARSIEADATRTGTFIGTPAYMSPEQVEGTPPDPRSDIYALGLVLYEMFVGAPACGGNTPVTVAWKQVREAPVPPRQLEPTLPAYVEAAILRCLEKDPARRFQSVDELKATLAGKTEAGQGAEGRQRRWSRKAWAGVGAILLASTIIVLLFFPYRPAQPTVTDEIGRPAQELPSEPATPSAAGDASETTPATPKRSAPSAAVRPSALIPAALSGKYTGSWESEEYYVSGVATMNISLDGEMVQAEVFLTGGKVTKDSLSGRLTQLGENVWRVEFKAQWSELKAEGIFQGDNFIGTYYYRDSQGEDRGKWNLKKVATNKN